MPKLNALPSWAYYAAGGALILLAPLVYLALVPPPVEEGVPQLEPVLPEDEPRVEQMLDAIRGSRYEEARAFLGSSLTMDYPEAAYPQFLEALRVHPNAKERRQGVLLHAELLQALVTRQIRPPRLNTHLRLLREDALSLGGMPFLEEVMGPLFDNADLIDYFPESRREVLDTLVLFERWPAALEVFQLLLTGAPEQLDMDDRLVLGRLIARIHGASGLPEAQATFEDYSEDLVERLGQARATEGNIRSWLRGVARFHAPDSSLDRGASLIQAGLPGNPAHPAFAWAHLDLAGALGEEALRRDNNLRAEFLPTDSNPARQLFLVGIGAARLGDREELSFAIRRLREDAGTFGTATEVYRALLLGLQKLLAGAKEPALQIIQSVLEDPQRSSVLTARDRQSWDNIVARGTLPRGGPMTLFENGKIWWKLRQWERLERAAERLSKTLTGDRDVACLNYLNAVLGYRRNELDKVQDLLKAILDEGPPPGLTRGEVASLLVLAEERAQEIARVDGLRTRTRETLERVMTASGPGNPGTQLARIYLWQLELDEGGYDFLVSDGATQRLQQLSKNFAEDSLDLTSLELWLQLEDQLLQLTQKLFGEGRLEAARDSLGRCRNVVRNPSRYSEVQARIFAAQAEELPRNEVERKRDLWSRAGDGFLRAADSNFGEQDYFYDAAEAFLAAGRFEDAARALASYSPNDRASARGESRYWQRFVLEARTQRLLGQPDRAIQVANENADHPDIGGARYDLILERGLAWESKGTRRDLEAAIRDYDVLYSALLPESRLWQRALYQKGRILHRQLMGSREDKAADVPRLRQESLRVWEDVSARIAEEGGSPMLAEALFRAAEGRSVIQHWALARAHYRRLESSARYVLESPGVPLEPAEVQRWRRFAEKGAFALADIYFEENDAVQARAHYQKAARQYPDSPTGVWAHYQLGRIAAREGAVQEARASFQLAEAQLASLDDAQLKELPPHQDRPFWTRTLREKIDSLAPTP